MDLSSTANIIKEREKFISTVEAEYQSEFRLLNDVYSVGTSLSVTMKRDPSDELRFFKQILFGSSNRTTNRIESIATLLHIGHCDDASLILRSIFDEEINLLFIAKSPIIRSFLYLRRGSRDIVEILRRVGPGETKDSEVAEHDRRIAYFEREISLFDNDLRRLDPNIKIPEGIHWSGRNTKEMADEVGLGDEYNVIYKDLSRRGHSLSVTSYVFSSYDEMRDELSPTHYPHSREISLLAIATAAYSLTMFKLYNQVIELGKEQEIQKLETEIGQFPIRVFTQPEQESNSTRPKSR